MNMQDMLREIETEVHETRHTTGIDQLDPRVLRAMASVPRDQFVPDELKRLAYVNGPLPIGNDQTISQPYIVALMTALLKPTSDSVILEVGTGSGYQAAVLAQLVKHVYSVEIIPELADAARVRLRELDVANVTVVAGDGSAGYLDHAPYDGIVVTAAAPRVPEPLVEQLKPGARLVLPIGFAHGAQDLVSIQKRADGTTRTRTILPVAFVPLTGTHGQAQLRH